MVSFYLRVSIKFYTETNRDNMKYRTNAITFDSVTISWVAPLSMGTTDASSSMYQLWLRRQLRRLKHRCTPVYAEPVRGISSQWDRGHILRNRYHSEGQRFIFFV